MHSNRLLPLFVIATLLLAQPYSVTGYFNRNNQIIEVGNSGETAAYQALNQVSKDRLAQLYSALPLTFEVNQGQIASSAKYLSRAE